MQRITILVFIGVLTAIALLASCKPDEPRARPGQSPLLSPLPTLGITPLPAATRYPTIVANIEGAIITATSGPVIIVTA